MRTPRETPKGLARHAKVRIPAAADSTLFIPSDWTLVCGLYDDSKLNLMTDTETAKEKIAAWRAIPVKTAIAELPLSWRPRVVPR